MNALKGSSHTRPLPSKEGIKNKYQAFQDFLALNNQAHEIIADVKEKLSGDYLFDRQYLKSSAGAMADKVTSMLQHLDVLSKGKYPELYDRHAAIKLAIENILSPNKEIPATDFVLPLDGLTSGMADIAGGKIAHLGEVKSKLELPVPEGFSITASAFKRFMDHNRLADAVKNRLAALDVGNMDEVTRFCREMQAVVREANLPEDLQNALQSAVDGLKSRMKQKQTGPSPRPLRVSVRSSAVQEDGESTFAGQYATFLNVPDDLIALKYKEVIASLFKPRAIFYYKTKGFFETEIIMPVGVLSMIDAKAGGVMYSRDPNTPESDTIIINAVWGLGKAVVDGSLSPHSYRVSRKDNEVMKGPLTGQDIMFICTSEGDITQAPVPDALKGIPCLTDEQIRLLSGYASDLERHYANPQDIEWAVDQNDQIYILQTRPLKILSAQGSAPSIPRRLEHYTILIDKGVIACRGIGYGRVFVARDTVDLRGFPDGGVLVTANMATDFVVVMEKASAIITDAGSITGHMAALAREFQVPMIVGTGSATALLQDGQEVTVDAMNCNVYQGRVEEILRFAGERSTFRDTHLFKTLERIVDRIAPLNLVSPDAENFRPEYCMTYHDITRFSHEKAMAEMFLLGDDPSLEEYTSVPLRAGIPMDAHLIDLGGGLRESVKTAGIGDVLSIPFAVFLRGMTAMRWPEPRPSDVKGFLGMIANTAAIPEAEIRETATRSYAILSGNYMNFSIRLGYHFSMVEAYVGENVNENYITFFFKGGGAATDRRLRRIRLITEILRSMDFRITSRGDTMKAALMKYPASQMETKLVIMGKLTAYTKQLDMVMYNDAVTDMFIEDFIRDHVKHPE